MTDTTHTPGSWKVENVQGDMLYVVADQGKSFNNPVICSLYDDVTPEDSVTFGPWLQSYENAEANARLISTAPELLAELIKLESLVSAWECMLSEKAGGCVARHLETARAAIAKAKE